MRHQDCKNYYNALPDLQWKDELFEVGKQAAYEWEQDIRSMRFAVKMLKEHIEYLKTKDSYKTFGDHIVDHALKELETRLGQFEIK